MYGDRRIERTGCDSVPGALSGGSLLEMHRDDAPLEMAAAVASGLIAIPVLSGGDALVFPSGLCLLVNKERGSTALLIQRGEYAATAKR